MGSPYLERIDALLNTASARRERDYLLAKRAGYLARVGEFQEAAAILASLRKTGDVYDDPKLSTFLTLADGLAGFYQDQIDLALDRFSRANALSKAAGLKDLVALSSSWLGHLSFGRFDFDRLTLQVSEAFSFVSGDDHECLARLCLVVAQSVHLAAGQASANVWYGRAHSHAIEVGDKATLSSIMYNRTAMRIVNCRQMLLSAGVNANEEAALTVSSAESTNNFDQLVGVVSLGDFTPILRAQTYSLARRFQEAEQLYSLGLSVKPNKAQARSHCWLLADRSYCLMQLGSVERAVNVAEAAIEAISSEVQVDDLGAAHARLADVFSACADMPRSEFHRDESVRAWEAFSQLQKGVASRMSQFDRLYLNL